MTLPKKGRNKTATGIAICKYYSSMRPQTVEKISSLAIAVAELMFDMAFWARRSRCKMASQMQQGQIFRAQMELAPIEQTCITRVFPSGFSFCREPFALFKQKVVTSVALRRLVKVEKIGHFFFIPLNWAKKKHWSLAIVSTCNGLKSKYRNNIREKKENSWKFE